MSTFINGVPALDSLRLVGHYLPNRPLVIGKAHWIFKIGDTRQYCVIYNHSVDPCGFKKSVSLARVVIIFKTG